VGVPFGAPVAHLSALPEGASTVVVGGRRIALLREGQAVYATDNACPHRAGPLGEGEVRGGTVTCPQHRFRFDLQTGVCVTNANLRVATYRVEIAGDDVIVHAPGETAG
jgi:nitrite reductase/ring-hydroxylating ferredoxin subunit